MAVYGTRGTASRPVVAFHDAIILSSHKGTTHEEDHDGYQDPQDADVNYDSAHDEYR